MRPLLHRFRVLGMLSFTLASAYTATPAHANGRFPKAQAIVTPPGDDTTIYMRATFGVIVSHDAGSTWSWMCEQSLGFSSTWDPPIAAARGGRLWVALTDGARTTADGCGVSDVTAMKGELVADLTIDGTGDHVFALSSPPGKPAFVWRSDGESKMTRLGKGVSGFRFDTVEVAPSNPKRVYLTATPDGAGQRAHFFRSDDGGATLRELSPALPTRDGRLFVAAVDPGDPDRVLVRELSASGSDVLLSTDGGQTFAVALHMKGAMFGFTRTPDGSAYYAGSGDAKEGIWSSVDHGATWKAGAKTSVFCLHATPSRLLVCSNPYMPGGYAIAESTDHGATVKPLATFDDVTGPVACDGGSACDATWPETRAAIATSAHTSERSFNVAPADASTPADAGAAGVAPSKGGSACGCTAAGSPDPSRAPLCITAFVTFVAVRRSRKKPIRGSLEDQRCVRPDHRRVATLPPHATGGEIPIRMTGRKS